MGEAGFEPATSGILRNFLNRKWSYKTSALTRLSYTPIKLLVI